MSLPPRGASARQKSRLCVDGPNMVGPVAALAEEPVSSPITHSCRTGLADMDAGLESLRYPALDIGLGTLPRQSTDHSPYGTSFEVALLEVDAAIAA